MSAAGSRLWIAGYLTCGGVGSAPLGRDQAITVLAIAELLARGYSLGHPLTIAFCSGLV